MTANVRRVVIGILALAIVIFLTLAFFWTPRLTRDQRQILYLLFTLAASATTALVSWFAVTFKGRRNSLRGTLSSSGALGVFALTYLVRPHWYMELPDVRADLVVAHLKERVGAPEIEISGRIVTDLQRRITGTPLGKLKVDVYPRTISSAQEAEQAAIDADARVLVWGWVDAGGIHVSVHTRGRDKERAPLDEVEWQMASGLGRDLALRIKGTVIPDVSFISLFAMGSAHYAGRDYPAGRAAFDLATRNMPPNAHLANPALLRFFAARALHGSSGFAGSGTVAVAETKDDIVCGYADAIVLDPTLYEPYVNLGVVLWDFHEETGEPLSIFGVRR